jgi:hypothetical protein
MIRIPIFTMQNSEVTIGDRRMGWGCLICCLIVSGCDSGPKLIPVSGQVKIDGKPLEMGVVMVWVKDHRPACGAIGKDGLFQLMTHSPGDGCVVGEHPVTVTSETGLKGDATQFFIPERYKDPKQSELNVIVDQPRDDWIIDLTWKGDSHDGPYIIK